MFQVTLAVRALLRHVKSTASASELLEDEDGKSTAVFSVRSPLTAQRMAKRDGAGNVVAYLHV